MTTEQTQSTIDQLFALLSETTVSHRARVDANLLNILAQLKEKGVNDRSLSMLVQTADGLEIDWGDGEVITNIGTIFTILATPQAILHLIQQPGVLELEGSSPYWIKEKVLKE